MTKKILVLDDESDILESVKAVLEREGYEVDTAQSGKECIEKSKKKKHDLIMIDIYMPGMSGIQVHKALRKTLNHLTPLMYVTIKPKAEIDLSDMEGFVQKPFENTELIKEMKKVIKTFEPPIKP